MRIVMRMSLPPDDCLEMLSSHDPRSTTYRESLKSVTLIKEFGPGDKVIRFETDIAWAIKVIVKAPDEIFIRMVTRKNWPEEGSMGYVVVPFDVKNNVCLDEFGPLKIKSGIISPDPEEEGNSIITMLDVMNFRYVPNFALAQILKKKIIPKM